MRIGACICNNNSNSNSSNSNSSSSAVCEISSGNCSDASDQSLNTSVKDLLDVLDKDYCGDPSKRVVGSDLGAFSYQETAKDCPGGNSCTSPSGNQQNCGSWTQYARQKCSKTKLPANATNVNGHHIVMKKKAEESTRKILCKYGIDPYCGCKNLAITRNRCHSNAYAEHVHGLLELADRQGTVRAVEDALDAAALHHSTCGHSGEVDETTDEAM